MKFTFDDRVRALGVRGVYFTVRGMTNRASDDAEVRAFVAERLAAVPPDLESSAMLQGFAEVHAKLPKRPKKVKAASAGLLAFYRARGDLPRVNGIVDVYNAVSLATGLAVGAHDLGAVTGDIALRLTDGSEGFWPIGAPEPSRVPAGEYAYVDGANDVLCRLEVRQVEKSKITASSRDVFFIVQGHDRVDPSAIAAGAASLAEACRRLFGGAHEALYP